MLRQVPSVLCLVSACLNCTVVVASSTPVLSRQCAKVCYDCMQIGRTAGGAAGTVPDFSFQGTVDAYWLQLFRCSTRHGAAAVAHQPTRVLPMYLGQRACRRRVVR